MNGYCFSSPAPSPTSSPATSSVAVVLIVDECLNNGIQHSGNDQVRQQQVDQNKGKCSDEQIEDPVVRIGFEHAKRKKDGGLFYWKALLVDAKVRLCVG